MEIKGEWGRAIIPANRTKIFIIFILTVCPIILLCLQITNIYFNGSILLSLMNLHSLYNFVPDFDPVVFKYTIIWIIFQLVLYYIPDVLHKILPSYKGGYQYGQTTPGGHLLKYQINGLQSWIITHLAFYIFSYKYEYIPVTFIADNWLKIFISANIIGYSLAIFSYVKAHKFPTHSIDNKYTKNFFYDFVMGIEFNPRIADVDFKLFFNGRPGIIAWTLINLSFLFSQIKNYGTVSNSMILVNILQGLYVLDFFWNENWYLKTIDITHDHFGWYLAWGDTVWLPFFYTMQTVYLSNNLVILGQFKFNLILTIGIIGYILFRWTNYQKDYFKNEKNPIIFNEPAKYITTTYTTKNGEFHYGKLLISGLWGFARHMNYTGDLILSFCYCWACGFNHILPYSYFIFMLILLISRCYRDEDRCSRKYGPKWNLYCKIVPYRLIPYIY
jgi:7-dehydrocholesterol reductase